MSLIRPVIRMTCMAALRGNTWAEDRVFDSRNTPLVTSLTSDDQANKPYVGIYTDTDDRSDIEGRAIYRVTRNLALVLELGVASQQTITNTSGSPQVTFQLQATDEGLEAVVDVLESQVIACLFGDVRDPWAELLRDMIPIIRRVPSHRGGSADRITRWAARQLTFVCETIDDFPPGVVPPSGHPVWRFIELADGASPDLGPAAQLVRAMINTESWPEWRQAQAWLTLTQKGVEAIGLAPLVVEGDEQPPIAHVLHVDEEDKSRTYDVTEELSGDMP